MYTQKIYKEKVGKICIELVPLPWATLARVFCQGGLELYLLDVGFFFFTRSNILSQSCKYQFVASGRK